MRVKQGLLLVAVCSFVISCSTAKKYEKFANHPLAIVQGTTDSNQTFISILSHKRQGDLKFFIETVGSEKKNSPVYSHFKKSSPDGQRVIEQIHIKNLDASKKYKLLVRSKGDLIDERVFKAQDLTKESVRIGVASCMDDHIGAASKMWESYLNKFLDVNFFIGDNVYADRLDGGVKRVADPEQLWFRYAQTWDRLYFYHASQLSPTYYLWDDHDYGKNDGGADYEHKEASKEIFWAFHPGGEIEGVYKKTFGAGSVLNAFDQKFLFIDGRYFRENGKGVHWGEEQKNLVLAELKKSSGEVNWLVSGDQFFGAYHPFESFEKNNPKEFKRTLKSLKATGKKIAFVSGDRHLTEIMKIEKKVLGYETVEITSSGIHAKVFPGAFLKSPNPRGEVGKSGVYNYSVIELYPKGRRFKVTSYGAKDWTHYTKEISL
ncbi:MAG: alkaline phosphatase D family protein [Bdellovibrionales bacterium]